VPLSPATRPLLGATPVAVFVPAGLQVAVIGGGVRMPAIQVAQEAPVEEMPISRAGSPAGVSGFLPQTPVAPPVPIYPAKQARH
jgi:hypothetical protein